MVKKSNIQKSAGMKYDIKIRSENIEKLEASLVGNRSSLKYESKAVELMRKLDAKAFTMVNPEYEYENNIEFLALKKEATIEMKENKIAILSKIVEKEELGFKKESKKLAVLNSGVDIAGKSDDEIEAIELC